MSAGNKYPAFKEKQWAVLEKCNKDVLAVLPTGYGKTLIIEALPYLKETKSCIILASPLNAILEEQQQRFGKR